MDIGSANRRAVLAGIAALAARPSFAEDPPPASPVAHGVLARNPIALKFERAPYNLPHVEITGPDGDRALADIIKGRTVLMPIWAEWCAPCLTELSDFARLQEVYGNDKFAIIPILSGTRRMFQPPQVKEILTLVKAAIFEPLIERKYGGELIAAMAQRGNSFEIPCNVLIAPDGRIVGREMGIAHDESKDSAPDAPKSGDELLSRAVAGQTQSYWGMPPGDEFAVCMAHGFLS
jgi:thiol-disulfide isomerase/thioredoxin